MLFWYTDNQISQTIAEQIERSGIKSKHIRDFNYTPIQPSIFYGILRGTGRAMHILKHVGQDFWYIDNGYFDAKYIDQNRVKDTLAGTYRVVRNDMMERYTGPQTINALTSKRKTALVLPPSAYAANYYDTTPEDWCGKVYRMLKSHGYEIVIREKGDTVPMSTALSGMDILVSFNSIGGLEAAMLGVPSYDSQGIFRNAHELAMPDFHPTISATNSDLYAFYSQRQKKLGDLCLKSI